jgi:superfamily II DNA/RNA helicase
MLFIDFVVRAEVLKGKLNDEGWPSNFIAGGQAQQQRLGTMVALKDFQIRVLISTDLV